MIQGLFGNLMKRNETTGLSPMQNFAQALDPLILPDMRMGEAIRQRGLQNVQDMRRNKTIQELEERANNGDAVAQRYLQGIRSGALDMKSGFAGYLNELAANERQQRDLAARAALAAAKPVKSYKLVTGKQLNDTMGTDYPVGALFQLGSDGSAKQVGGNGQTINVGGDSDTLIEKLRAQSARDFGKYLTAGDVGKSQVQDFDVLQKLLAGTPDNVVDGYLEQNFPKLLGSDATQISMAIIKRVAPTLRVEGSGSTSDIEYQGMLDSLGNMMNSQEARSAIYQMMQSKAAFNVQRADIIRSFQQHKDEDRLFNELDELGIPEAQLAARIKLVTQQFTTGSASNDAGTTTTGIGWSF